MRLIFIKSKRRSLTWLITHAVAAPGGLRGGSHLDERVGKLVEVRLHLVRVPPRGLNSSIRLTLHPKQRSIRLALFGTQLFEKQFPPGVERTWCLSYTDASCRVVRAGVDGGRSIVREAGLVDKNAGEAKDAYLFFMERAPDYVAD